MRNEPTRENTATAQALAVIAGTALLVALIWSAWTHGYAWLLLLIPVLLIMCRIGWWALVPSRKMPTNRVRRMRIRLWFRVHPGRGFATTWTIRRRFSGRALARREGRYMRPSIPVKAMKANPDLCSFDLGRAHLRQEIRLPYNRNLTIIGPPRSNKSAAMGAILIDFPGAVLTTSTKDDQFRQTSGIRSQLGPVYVFNPMGIGLTPSTIQVNPVRGCADESTAFRRATAFCEATSGKDMDGGNDGFWDDQASDAFAALLCAADLVGADMRLVQSWALGNASMAVHILQQAGKHGMTLALYEFAFSPAEKTVSTIRMVMKTAFGFMRDPKLAACVLPTSEERNFSFTRAVTSGATLYLIGDSVGKSSPMAALFAWMANEWKHAATVAGSKMPGGRLDPPTQMDVDEAAAICPLPLPTMLQDCAGQGIQIITVAHGIAQLEGRWKEYGRRTIMDTSSLLVLPGVKDPELLKWLSDVCGKAFLRDRGQEARYNHNPLLTEDMIRQLPDHHAILISDNEPPVIIRLNRIWDAKAYRQAITAGTAVAEIEVPAHAPMLDVAIEWAPLMEKARREIPGLGKLPDPAPAPSGKVPVTPQGAPRRAYGPARKDEQPQAELPVVDDLTEPGHG